MAKRRCFIGLAVLGLLSAVAFFWRFWMLEPRYEGQPLRYWIARLPEAEKLPWGHDSTAREAIRATGPESVPYLLKAMQDSRLQSLYGRLWRKLPQSVRSHLPAPTDRGPIKTSAAKMLVEITGSHQSANFEKAVPALIRLRVQRDGDVGWHVTSALGNIAKKTRNQAAIAVFVQALESPDRGVRSSAVSQMASWGPEAQQVLPALRRTLKDPDPGVRLMAAGAIHRIGGPGEELVPVLLECLKMPRLREGVARQCSSIGAPAKAAIPALTVLLQETNVNVRNAAARALRKIHPEKYGGSNAIPFLIEQLKDPEGNIRWNAANELKELGPNAAPAIPALRDCFNHNKTHNLWAVAEALLSIDPRQADVIVPEMIDYLRNTNSLNRHMAAAPLGHAGAKAKAALPLLIAELQSEHTWVRKTAAEAILKIAGDGDNARAQAFKVLIGSLLRKREIFLRRSTAKALGEFGPAAKEAVPALLEAARSTDEELSKSALESLKQIDPKAVEAETR